MMEPDTPEEEEVPEEPGSRLGYAQILGFCAGFAALLLSILLLVFVVRRHRTSARHVNITQDPTQTPTPDIVTEAAQVDLAADSEKGSQLSTDEPGVAIAT